MVTGNQTLLVDAGNSRLKWALLQKGARSEQQACSYPDDVPSHQAALDILKRLSATQSIDSVVVVHVLGESFSAELEVFCQRKTCHLQIVKSAVNTYGIKLAYANPAHFGADRLVGLVAARALAAGRTAIMIDCGTAVTVDGLLSGGRHPGGLITPGLGLLSQSLIRNTRAGHMDTSRFDNPRVFTDNTAAAIGSGCLYSLAGSIEGICQRMQQQMSEVPLKIICGGDAARIHPLLQGEFLLHPEALMDGLQAIAEYK